MCLLKPPHRREIIAMSGNRKKLQYYLENGISFETPLLNFTLISTARNIRRPRKFTVGFNIGGIYLSRFSFRGPGVISTAQDIRHPRKSTVRFNTGSIWRNPFPKSYCNSNGAKSAGSRENLQYGFTNGGIFRNAIW